MKRRLLAILILSILGVALSAYALVLHYGTGESACDFSAYLNCDVVNRGAYSEIAGIPVAVFGILGYLAIGIAAIVRMRSRPIARYDLLILSIGGFAFSLYLTYLELFVIYALCPVCVASAVVITAIWILAMIETYGSRNVDNRLPRS